MMRDMFLYAKWEINYSSFILDFLVISENCLSLDGDDLIILPKHIDPLVEGLEYIAMNPDNDEAIS
jgi:hypothetical protein